MAAGRVAQSLDGSSTLSSYSLSVRSLPSSEAAEQWDDFVSMAGGVAAGRPPTSASPSYSVSSRSNASVVVTELHSLGLITLGCDCTGLCTPFHALRDAGYKVELAFACDVSPRAKAYCLDVCQPVRWYDDVMGREVNAMPRVDVYTAGFPCQPFSSLGLRGGVRDPRGIVADGCIAYITYHLSAVFFLENVRRLLTIDGGDVFRAILDKLVKLSNCAYDVSHTLTNTELHGTPQHRPRLYIDGRLRSSILTKFAWPAPLQPVPLSSLLDLSGSRPPISTQLQLLSVSAGARLQDFRAKIRAGGGDPETDCYVVDVDDAQGFGSLMLERSPCLLASCGRGYYLTHLGRRMTLCEMSRFQSFSNLPLGPLSSVTVGPMLGNAMSCSVVKRLFAAVIPTFSFGSHATRSVTDTSMVRDVRGCAASPRDGSLESLGDGSSLTLSALLFSLATAVLGSGADFGHFASTFLSGHLQYINGRCRDVLPFPLATASDCDACCDIVSSDLFVRLLNLSVAGLDHVL